MSTVNTKVHPISNKVGGVFIHVSNMEKSAEWYHKLFGMPQRSNVTGKVHALKMLESSSDFVLDQHGFDRGFAIEDRAILMIDSPDVHAAYRFMKQNGITIESRIEEYPGMAFFTFRDPDNNLLMICGTPGMENEEGEQAASAEESAAQPIRYDGGGTWLIVSDQAKGRVTKEGLELTGSAGTEEAFAAPVRIETTVRLESGSLLLKYGPRGYIRFNYGEYGSGHEFYVQHPSIKKSFSYLDKGGIPTGEWVHIEWIIRERSMEVRVNEELFHKQEGYLGNPVDRARIVCDNGRVTVKSFFAESLSEKETLPGLPIYSAGGKLIDELQPDPACYPVLTGEGLWLAQNEHWGSARTKAAHKVPFTMEATVRTDTNTVILYGGASARVTFHHDGHLSFQDPVSKQVIWSDNNGQLSDQFTKVTWTMEEEGVSVSVDGEVRFSYEGDYSNCSFPLGIGADTGSAIVVKAVEIK